MAKGVQWIKERSSTTMCLLPPNPVVFGRDRMRQTSIHHLAHPKSTPTKYRRPSEGRRDSSKADVVTVRPKVWRTDSLKRPICAGFSSVGLRAISRRYPLTGDCVVYDFLENNIHKAICVFSSIYKAILRDCYRKDAAWKADTLA